MGTGGDGGDDEIELAGFELAATAMTCPYCLFGGGG